jgi:hypothetical protein
MPVLCAAVALWVCLLVVTAVSGRPVKQARTVRELAQFEVDDFWTKVADLVQDVCFRTSGEATWHFVVWWRLSEEDLTTVSSGTSCDDIDYKGTTKWYKKYFSDKPPMLATPGYTPLVLQNNSKPYQTSLRTFKCAYDPYTNSTCRLDGQTISSNTVTDTHTKSFSFQSKIGILYKQKSLVNEVTFEWWACLMLLRSDL